MESRFSQEKWDFFCFSIKAEKAKPLKEKTGNWWLNCQNSSFKSLNKLKNCR